MKRLGIAVSVLVVALVGSLLVRVVIVENEDPLVVVHWSNSHPMREGLLEDMAKEFNDAGHETASGQPIEIKVIECDSADQVEDLVARTTGGAGLGACDDEDGAPAADPTIVTPQSDDWFGYLNYLAGDTVVDPDTAKPLAEAYLGIVTNRNMADCLRSSDEPIGYVDILELAERGWSTAGCDNKSSWGTQPRLSFTNPSTSTSGRNVLVTLYAIYAGDAAGPKPLGQLSPEDVPRVQDKVHDFQAAVDHYMPSTLALNTMIADKEADFFLLPEDNVVGLYKGLEDGRAEDGTKKEDLKVQGLSMLYPEEGSVLNSNPAGIVDGSWVGSDELEAANSWIDYLREENQQRDFMAAGFRPASDTGLGLKVDEDQYAQWGLDAREPEAAIDPGDVDGKVLDEIIGSWGAVKKPSVVTFVVDLSDSMQGNDKLDHVQEGLRGILDEMEAADAESSMVGLVTFGDSVAKPITPRRLTDVGELIGDAITAMRADQGHTALYDAVETAIELTDGVEAEGASRAVVVLSDGHATTGNLCLHDIVEMRSEETDIVRYCANTGMADTAEADDVDEDGLPLALDKQGREVSPNEVEGDRLTMDLKHKDLKVFFVGFGEADINVGRILAGATDADYQKSTDDGLASVIQALSGYF